MQKFARIIRGQCVFTLLLVFGLMSWSAFGQDANGRILGVVTDPSGSVIPNVKVTVTNAGTGAVSPR